MKENKIKVYIKIDTNKCITNIESSIVSQYIDFSKDWILIDEGYEDKYVHAQGMYFPKDKPLMDNNGIYNYKYIDCKITELSPLEKSKLIPQKHIITKKQEEFNTEVMLEIAKIKSKLGVE